MQAGAISTKRRLAVVHQAPVAAGRLAVAFPERVTSGLVAPQLVRPSLRGESSAAKKLRLSFAGHWLSLSAMSSGPGPIQARFT